MKVRTRVGPLIRLNHINDMGHVVSRTNNGAQSDLEYLDMDVIKALQQAKGTFGLFPWLTSLRLVRQCADVRIACTAARAQ